MNSVNEFVDYSVTENRLNQAIEQVFTSNNLRTDIKNTGDFIKWIMNDVLKEETDTLVKNNLIWKDVQGVIAKKASRWFKEYLDLNL
jgi:alpha-acetolactate decarboxylase